MRVLFQLHGSSFISVISLIGNVVLLNADSIEFEVIKLSQKGNTFYLYFEEFAIYFELKLADFELKLNSYALWHHWGINHDPHNNMLYRPKGLPATTILLFNSSLARSSEVACFLTVPDM